MPRAAGPFNYPSEMVADPAGDLYVSDGYRNARVHRFAPDGQLKRSWGEPGKTAPNQFHLPHSLLVHEGRVYVCDRENHRIQIFTTDGQPITMWTDVQQPMDISIDPEGVFYVSEGRAGSPSARISVLDGTGAVLARFDCRGSGHGSWVDAHGDIYLGVGEPNCGIDKYVRQG